MTINFVIKSIMRMYKNWLTEASPQWGDEWKFIVPHNLPNRHKKEIVVLETSHEIARLEENDCDSNHRDEHWIHTRPTWSIADRERLLELFCD